MERLENRNEVVYRCIGEDFEQGVLSCGFMHKPSAAKSQLDFTIGYYSCFLLLEGRGEYVTAEGERYRLEAGCLAQRFPGRPHSTLVEEGSGWLEFFISFGEPVFRYMESLGLLHTARPVFPVLYDETLLHSCSVLLERLKRGAPQGLPGLLLEAQDLVLTLHTRAHAQEEALYDSSIREACALLSEPGKQAPALPDVARRINMSYENFRKTFTRLVGISPAAYRARQRMEQAKLLLLSGVSIKETAQMVGYADAYSFTKQFTKLVGTAPGGYVRRKGLLV